MAKIANVSEHIAKGDFVRTNGDGRDNVIPGYIEGEVLKVGKEFFYVGHDNPHYAGKENIVTPRKHGWDYVWCIGLNNRVADITQILNQKQESNPCGNTSECVQEQLDCAPVNDCEPVNVGIISINVNPKPMSIFKQMSVYLRRTLSPNTRTQVKAGFRGADLRLTELGRSELRELLAAKFEEELTARASEVIADEKAEDEE